jgi:uncharacterized protein (DUF2252 family)
MLASPFAFFRGGAAIMAADLAGSAHTGLTVQLCGDAHLANFGLYAAPDRALVFDLNDFDETHPGPFEWDLKRLAASVAVLARHRGFDARAGAAAATAAVRGYREAIRTFAGMGDLDVWYARQDATALAGRLDGALGAADGRRFDRLLEQAHGETSAKALARFTDSSPEPRIASDPPLVVPIEELIGDESARAAVTASLRAVLAAYRRSLPNDRRHLVDRYRYVHMAHKVVGVGSVGLRAWIVLLLGSGADDPLFLQVKEATASVLEQHLGPSGYGNAGRRVVEGQRLLQAASDIFLGWVRAPDVDGPARDYYVRQLWDGKGTVKLETIRSSALNGYAAQCGAALARGHARSGDRVAIAAYVGAGDRLDRALTAFARAYTDQNERDYQALVAAVRSGRIHADPSAAPRA